MRFPSSESKVDFISYSASTEKTTSRHAAGRGRMATAAEEAAENEGNIHNKCAVSEIEKTMGRAGGCFIKIPFRGKGQLSPSGKIFSLFMKQQVWEDGPFGKGVNSALWGRDFTLS